MFVSCRCIDSWAIKVQVSLIVSLFRFSAFMNRYRPDSCMQCPFHIFALRSGSIGNIPVSIIIGVPDNGCIPDIGCIHIAGFIMAPYIPVTNVTFVHKTPVVCWDICPPVITYRDIDSGI